MSLTSFRKMHGCGNSFLVAQATAAQANQLEPQIQKLCSYQFGIGSDGIMLVEKNKDDTFNVYMYNPDGSLMGMCGNGIRCVARFIYEEGLINSALSSDWIKFSVEGRRIECRLHNDAKQVEVNMGAPRFLPQEIPINREEEVVDKTLSTLHGDFKFSAVSMGNPHCIIFVDSLDNIDIAKIGPVIEHHQDFPKRTNVEFVERVSDTKLKLKVWERGAGITLACGTGACASLVAAVRTGRIESKAVVELPGGSVEVEWQRDRNIVLMTGPAENIANIQLSSEMYSLHQASLLKMEESIVSSIYSQRLG